MPHFVNRVSDGPANYAAAAPALVALFAFALLAFWPTYLSKPAGASSVYIHLHAATAVLWMLTLVVQPLLVRARRVDAHRALGRVTYLLAPLVLLSIVLLANHRIRTVPPQDYPIQTYVLYLQVSLALVFGGLYAAAVALRRHTPLHARLMVCTALTLVDPIAIRLMFWADPTPSWNYQWATFGLTDLILLAMIALDHRHPPGRVLLAGVLVAFVASQVPALSGLTEGPAWQAFARWFAGVALT